MYIIMFIDIKGLKYENKFPIPASGVGLAIVKDGEVYSRGFGLADIDGRRDFDADTIACGGSTGKFFTATLLAILMTEHNRRGGK